MSDFLRNKLWIKAITSDDPREVSEYHISHCDCWNLFQKTFVDPLRVWIEPIRYTNNTSTIVYGRVCFI